MNGNHQTTEKKNPLWSTKKSNHDYHTGGIENIITYLQGASCRQDKWEILIMEGRIYDSRMNGNRTDLVLHGSSLKNTTGTHSESSCKINSFKYMYFRLC
jgi:hypothetical protein